MIERINLLIKNKAKSVREFAAMIGVQQNTLNQQLIGSRKVSLETISAILSSFDDISSEWLMRGIGNVYKDSEASANTEYSTEDEREEETEKDRFYQDIILTYQEMAKEYRKKIEYLESELAKIAPFAGKENKKESGAA